MTAYRQSNLLVLRVWCAISSASLSSEGKGPPGPPCPQDVAARRARMTDPFF